MLDTRTRLHAAMPAERRASSNEVSFSRCLPTPFVKKSCLGTNQSLGGPTRHQVVTELHMLARVERIVVNCSDSVKKGIIELWSGPSRITYPEGRSQ